LDSHFEQLGRPIRECRQRAIGGWFLIERRSDPLADRACNRRWKSVPNLPPRRSFSAHPLPVLWKSLDYPTHLDSQPRHILVRVLGEIRARSLLRDRRALHPQPLPCGTRTRGSHIRSPVLLTTPNQCWGDVLRTR